MWGINHSTKRTKKITHYPCSYCEKHHHNKEICGNSKCSARLFYTTQINQHNKQHARDGDNDAVGKKAWIGGYDLSDSCGHGYGYGQNVIHKQGGPGGLSRQLAQIVTRDDVSASSSGISMDGLFIRDRDNGKQDDDHQRYREDVAECSCPGRGQNNQDFLACICCGGKRIRGEDG